MPDIAIKLTNIGKEYLVTHQKPTLIGNILGSRVDEKFWALEDINLTVKKGERVGILGPNGAGKTTLLKIISGITTPTMGKVATYGKIVSLMELEAGFHPELTGEENIYLNGLLTGMNKKDIKKEMPKIKRFAEIGKFIDAPFYTYSTGMQFRLAFAIAMASECEILIMDEIFVSGDVEFQKKSFSLIREMQEKSNITTVITSHIGALVWGFSNIFYRLEEGRIRRVSTSKMRKLVEGQDKIWRRNTRLLY